MISSSDMTRRWFWLSFVCIVILAALLRLWQLGHIPVSLYWDEAAMFVDVKSVLSTGKDMHGRPWFQLIYPSYGDYKLPVYIWAATASARIFGLSEFSLRLPSAIAGVLTVLIAGGLVRELLELFAKKHYRTQDLDFIQLATMAVTALTPWSLLFSRTAFEGHIGQMLLGLSILLTAYGFRSKHNGAFFLAPVVAALATYSYYSVRFVWFAAFGAIVLFYLWNTRSQKQIIRDIGVKSLAAVVLFVLCLLPLLRSPLAKDADKFRLGTASVLNNENLMIQSNIYRELAGNSRIDRVFYNRYWLMARELIKNYSDNLSPNFLFVQGDPNLRHGTGQVGLFYLIYLPFFLIGFAVLFRRHLPIALIIIIWWMAALLPASVPENTPHALRSLNALVPLVMIIGLGMSWVLKRVGSQVLTIAVLAVVAISFAQFWWFYTTVYPKTSANDWQSGYAPLAKAVLQHSQSGKTVYIKPFDDRFYLWLMAYGPFDGKDFQQWKTADYKFVASNISHPFSKIEFSLPEDKQIREKLSQGEQIEVVGESESISTLCLTATLYSCTLSSIADEAGQEKFVIATLQPKTP